MAARTARHDDLIVVAYFRGCCFFSRVTAAVTTARRRWVPLQVFVLVHTPALPTFGHPPSRRNPGQAPEARPQETRPSSRGMPSSALKWCRLSSRSVAALPRRTRKQMPLTQPDTSTSARLMLLDTYGLVYRAFFALPGLTTTKGIPINAVYGFTMMLNKIITDEKPTHVIAAFDKGMPADRVALYSEYKAQRVTMPDELRSQFALVRQALKTFDIPIVEIDGQEADDIIATLACQAEEQGQQTLVVTGDLDLLQIVDERTTVLATRRGITDLGRYDPAAVRERFDLDPKQLPDYRGLKGDPSDNLPGVPGIGEKTASKLIKSAGTLDNLVARPELAGSPKLQKSDRRIRRPCQDLSRCLNRSSRSRCESRLGCEPLHCSGQR